MFPPAPAPPAVEKILVHDSLVGDQLNALLKALQDAGGWALPCVGAGCAPHMLAPTAPGESCMPQLLYCCRAAARAALRWGIEPRPPSRRTPLPPMLCLRAGVTLHGGERAAGALSLPPAPSPRHEYSSLDVTIELVGGMNEAIDHIHTHGSGHTECILTEDKQVRVMMGWFNRHSGWYRTEWSSGGAPLRAGHAGRTAAQAPGRASWGWGVHTTAPRS